MTKRQFARGRKRRNPALASALSDFYKLAHRDQYPNKTQTVYSPWTPRSNKHYPEAKSAIAFGISGFVQTYLIDFFEDNFFSRPKEEVIAEYVRFIKYTLFVPDPPYQHIADLHDLGYLPLDIRSLDEGTRCPFRVPMATFLNTDKRFFWVTNYVETIASSEMWMPSTSATTSDLYRSLLEYWAETTGGPKAFVPFQGHDFSMRGMPGLFAAMSSGGGHLTSLVGTDTAPAIGWLEMNYNANIETELVGTSVPATEHSVMCSNLQEGEYETYRRLIQDIYPTGIISIVSDTWDLWYVVTVILPKLKAIILARNGGPDSIDKVVIRPDSGDPADIICGTHSCFDMGKTSEEKGLVELLWDIFGGTTNEAGFKELHPCIGAIYGDSITLERCDDICYRLAQKGFASTNVVFGLGSYTYQYKTRDSLGYAMKATAVIVDGEERMIFKDPKTDDGTKKSAKGAVRVVEEDGKLVCVDQQTISEAQNGDSLLKPLFLNGKMVRQEKLSDIRRRLDKTRRAYRVTA